MSTHVTWSELIASSTPETETGTFWNGLIFIVLTAAIVGLFILSTRSRNNNVPAKAARSSEASALVKAPQVSESWFGIETDPMVLLDGTTASSHADDALVKAKSAGNRLWNTPEDHIADMPIPDDPNSAFSYSKFQQALLSGVDRQVEHTQTLKINNVKDLEAWNEQLSPLREMLARSNKTIQQFMDEQNVDLPDDVLEMWEAVKHMKVRETSREASLNSNVSAEEAASLMKDAIQLVPTSNVDFATTILREILHARTEGLALGIQIPPLSPEQQRTLEFWRVSGQMPAADLASKLLSR
jgi:hypothetical protein